MINSLNSCIIIVTLVLLLPSAGAANILDVRKPFTYVKIDEKAAPHKNAMSTFVTVFFYVDLFLTHFHFRNMIMVVYILGCKK